MTIIESLPKSQLVKSQTMEAAKTIKGGKERIVCVIRWDDQCGNGHNSFSITGTIYEKQGNGRWLDAGGGCIHEEIEKYFPEFKHLIKWHMMTSEGPWGYVENTTYHAGNRDHWGKLEGEPHHYETRVKFGNFPITFSYKKAFIEWLESIDKNWSFEVVPIPHVNRKGDTYDFSPKYTVLGFGETWYDCPFDTEEEALRFASAWENYPVSFVKTATSWGKGKPRELDAARRSAVWPEATDEQLMLEKEELKQLLLDRLPGLMWTFKADIDALGLTY